MTSLNRGKENEEEGEAKMAHGDDLGDKIAGAGQKIAGEVEQGVGNLGDALSRKQSTLQGDVGRAADRAGDWVQDRGRDMENAGRNMSSSVDSATDRAGDWAENRGDDIGNAADRAGDWVENRGDD